MKRSILVVLLVAFTVGVLYAKKNTPVPVNVATYNLRYNNPADGDNVWPNRKEHVKALLSGTEFYFFSVHFDHQAVEARKESGKLMVTKIKEIAGATPVFCVGDFNSTPETEQIQTIKTLLSDTYEVMEAPPYGHVGTFNAFKFDAPMKNRIDFAFVSDGIRVSKYTVLTDSYEQRYPSDHQPVIIKAVIK